MLEICLSDSSRMPPPAPQCVVDIALSAATRRGCQLRGNLSWMPPRAVTRFGCQRRGSSWVDVATCAATCLGCRRQRHDSSWMLPPRAVTRFGCQRRNVSWMSLSAPRHVVIARRRRYGYDGPIVYEGGQTRCKFSTDASRSRDGKLVRA
jgi:hypothetical protein